MSKPGRKISLLLVSKFVVLMLAVVFILIKAFNQSDQQTSIEPSSEASSQPDKEPEDILAAKAMYRTLKGPKTRPQIARDPRATQRNLARFYALRAYSGAPPMIPHEIAGTPTLTGDSCLGCHQKGGYTPKWNAYAPVTPHPQMTNCRQCHITSSNGSLFKPSSWVNNSASRGVAHLTGSPLTIPHSLQLREPCLSCHSGPAAVQEIQTSHPERVNCLQCHVQRLQNGVWVR